MGLHRVKHKDAIKRLAIKVTADVFELHWFGLALQSCLGKGSFEARHPMQASKQERARVRRAMR